MRLKVSTPQKVVYQDEIKSISLPTENGTMTITPNQKPLVTALKPGLIKIHPLDITNRNDYIFSKNEIVISIDKGMVFVDGSIVRIVSSNATTIPSESSNNLLKKKEELEQEIKKIRSQGSIEDLEKYMNKLQKINADITLEKMKELA